jgi:DNA-binding MarR family transcriptional regulator
MSIQYQGINYMKTAQLRQSNLRLWGLLGEASHAIMLARQKELSQYGVPVRQYEILRSIRRLGSKATVTVIAKQQQRKDHVISRQTVIMEKNGLITRTKNTPKSNILKLELTSKGLSLITVRKHSKIINIVFSSLSGEERQQIEYVLNNILTKLKEYIDS